MKKKEPDSAEETLKESENSSMMIIINRISLTHNKFSIHLQQRIPPDRKASRLLD